MIASSENDDTVIGYHWRLSGSHPEPDVCDYYAGIEMGLGRGVWTKDAVPREKAHPHCMCTLVPRVRPRAEKGSGTYADFVREATPERRAALLPQWANGLNRLGMPLEKMLRPDGLGLLTREKMEERMGDRLMPALSLGRSVTERDWGKPTLDVRSRAGRETFDGLTPHVKDPVVRRILDALRAGPRRVPVDGLDLHYAKRRYIDGAPIKSRVALDAVFDRTVRNPESRMYIQRSRDAVRYAVYDEVHRWVSIVDPNGRRVSAFPLPPENDPDKLGELRWRVKDLLS